MKSTRHLVDVVRSTFGLGNAESDTAIAEDAVKAVLRGIVRLVEEDEDRTLILKGFGTFKMRDRKASTTRNPRSGELMEVPASTRIHFKQARGK